jgi:hypothetical protein
MSRLEVPLRHRTLRATGDTVLWADLVLSLKTNRGVWKQIPFRVDSGTEMTTMPAFEARSPVACWWWRTDRSQVWGRIGYRRRDLSPPVGRVRVSIERGRPYGDDE